MFLRRRVGEVEVDFGADPYKGLEEGEEDEFGIG